MSTAKDSTTDGSYAGDIDIESQQLDRSIIGTQETNGLIGDNQTKAFIMEKVGTRNFGRNFVFFLWNGEPLITIGPHWPFFVCMAFTIVTAGIVISQFIATNRSVFHVRMTIAVMLMNLSFYTITAFKNPGLCSKTIADNIEETVYMDKKFCMKCGILRSKGIKHCVDCDVCVKGYDHHCPWTGKCIGEGNIVWFYLFLASTMIFMFFTIIMSVRLI